jgi:arginine decarboxylase
MPLHRLDEEPTVRATLADITCDSDGHLTDFVLNDPNKAEQPCSKSLLLHEVPVSEASTRSGGGEELETYVLGMFLGGAYQETMGSAHNLFGSTNVVSVRTKDSPFGPAPESRGSVKETEFELSGIEGAYVESMLAGQNVAHVLLHGDHVAQEVVASMRAAVDQALTHRSMTQPQADCLLQVSALCLLVVGGFELCWKYSLPIGKDIRGGPVSPGRCPAR